MYLFPVVGVEAGWESVRTFFWDVGMEQNWMNG